MAESTGAAFKEWALLELMGHRRMAGLVQDAAIGGAALTRIDVYVGLAPFPAVTQFYGGAAIYCITPMGEDECRRFAARNVPEPVARFELAPAVEASAPTCADCGAALTADEIVARRRLCSDCDDGDRTADADPARLPF